jgi:hypothetical protein
MLSIHALDEGKLTEEKDVLLFLAHADRSSG